MAKRLIGFIALLQSVLLLAHLFLYETWVFSSSGQNSSPHLWAQLSLGLLSVSFVAASVMAFRYTSIFLRAFYRIAAVWMGLFSFLFFAAIFSWLVFAVARVIGINPDFHRIVQLFFVAALLLGAYAVFNADWVRITRTKVHLPNLPELWRGRKAALISDLHLGHVRNGSFLRRMVSTLSKEKPNAIFIAGDLYDGTAIDAGTAAEPLNKLTAPNGIYFVAGNHEQFGDDSKYLDAVSATGVRVLDSEKVEVDGLQIVGVPYRSATQSGHLSSALRDLGLDPDRASILLTHAPDYPRIAEAAGISLQLSGHTHLGQFIPWSWVARRIYKQFVYGLSRIGKMQVFTSSGAGTWGPPLRLGSNPEIVILEFV